MPWREARFRCTGEEDGAGVMAEGRNKGARFEADICKALSGWRHPDRDFSKVPQHELPFRRRFTTSTSLEGHWQGHGDILHRPEVKFPFTVECKKQENWDMDGMLTNAKWPPALWWGQAVSQAETAKRHPMLIFARNLREPHAMIREDAAECLLRNGVPRTVLTRQDIGTVVVVRLGDLVTIPWRRLASLRQPT